MSKMVKVHNDQLEAQRQAVLMQREKERQEREKEKADREEEKKKKKAEVAAEKRELQDAYNKKILDILKKQGEIRAGEHDRMEQIMNNMQKELEDRWAGRNPEEDFNPEFTEDESVPVAGAPRQLALRQQLVKGPHGNRLRARGRGPSCP